MSAPTGARIWGRQSLARGGVELKLFFRERGRAAREAVLLLFLLASIFGGQITADAEPPALLPDELARFEAAGAWEHGRIALVLSAWCVGGLLLCLGTFRWRSSRDG